MIEFDDVTVRFGAAEAVRGVSVTIPAGALAVLVGPSGSGKTTLLRLVNRMATPSAGRVRVRGEDVAAADPARLRRSIGYVMQSMGLFPHWSVARNIGTVPALLGWPAARIAARVEELLALVRLDPALAGRRPAALSGGQAQRVGLARALAADPDILLMDEPFGAVDPIVRRELRAELTRIHAATGKTILLVTHDPIEALELATHLVVLREGQLVAAGEAAALAAPPAPPFLRALFGAEALALRRLSLLRVEGAALDGPAPAGAPVIAPEASLAEAWTLMQEHGAPVLAVGGRHLPWSALLPR
ncbi:ATP-binding cassette domain-containing protein [Roseococcus suduntuyensis]|uniref:Osmoprotectant transport system ATP-binding protein n=1 Tax=Roseococcus suduntuyensis TaxID=455361 RepID=A0A840ABH9_9PROT|nr:ATP-binding cassette domain-containing protein [Roseococcus suduntuyensis]MBB3898252.1 osmoprotectant transport system ATP-binding protein [Roseococcus suduntuyensis]